MKKKLPAPGFMVISLGLFGVSLLTSLVIGIRAVSSNGTISYGEGIAVFACLLLCLAGFLITLYGHYVVKAESRLNFRLGLFTNGGLLLVLLFLYFLGI